MSQITIGGTTLNFKDSAFTGDQWEQVASWVLNGGAEGIDANAQIATEKAAAASASAAAARNSATSAGESATAAANSAASAAESIKHAPRINDDGKWELWDATTNAYVATEYTSIGKDGVRGLGWYQYVVTTSTPQVFSWTGWPAAPKWGEGDWLYDPDNGNVGLCTVRIDNADGSGNANIAYKGTLKGAAGSSIQSIDRTSGTGAPGTKDTYTVTLTNGNTTTFQVYNGKDGSGSGDMTKAVYDPQGKAQDIFAYADAKYSKPSGGIPKKDLASAVQTSLGKADSALQSVPSTYRTASAQDTIDSGKQSKITASGLLKGNGAGGVSEAVKGTDYAGPSVGVSVTLTASGWNANAKTQTVSVSGVTATANCIITASPDSYMAYAKAGVRCTAQGAGTLTFACETVPTANVVANVLIIG